MVKRDKALALIRAYGEQLTERQLDVLARLAEAEDDDDMDEAEIVREHGEAYIGTVRIASRTVNALLRACAIRRTSEDRDEFERFSINETGRQLLAARKEPR
jgi:hypothetical protein